MKKIFIVLSLFVSAFIFGGCQLQSTSQPAQNLTVEKTGILQVKTGDSYLLNTSDGIVNITSNKVNLDNYLKKQVKVTGGYSGDLLYVDQIEGL